MVPCSLSDPIVYALKKLPTDHPVFGKYWLADRLLEAYLSQVPTNSLHLLKETLYIAILQKFQIGMYLVRICFLMRKIHL